MTLNTGYMGYLTMERSKEVEPIMVNGRMIAPSDVTYLAMRSVVPIQPLPLGRLYTFIAIFSSVVTCVMCALVYDWFSFSTILIGIISGGLATSVIGEGRLVIDSGEQRGDGARLGHAILVSEHEIMVIKGEERDVKTIREDVSVSRQRSHARVTTISSVSAPSYSFSNPSSNFS